MSADASVPFSLAQDDLGPTLLNASDNAPTPGDTGLSAGAKLLDMLSDFGPFNPPIVGTNGNDVLAATADGDVVLGLGGNDQLSSTFNRTALFGGTGNDSLTTNLVVPEGTQPTDGVAFQFGGDGQDTLSSTIKIQGPVPTAPPVAGVVAATNFLDGGAGNDAITATLGIDAITTANVTLKNVVFGGAGNDHMDLTASGVGSLSDDTVSNVAYGGAGDDHITALAQAGFLAFNARVTNVINGGDGNDFIEATAIGRSLQNPLTSNTLYGGSGNDVLHAFNDVNANGGPTSSVMNLAGGDGDDVLVAVSQTRFSLLTAPDDSSQLEGGAGNDSLSVDVSTGSGIRATSHNLLEGGSGDDTLAANLSMRVALAPSSALLFDAENTLNGDSGNDSLNANLSILNDSHQAEPASQLRAENHLNGGSGNDQLTAFAQLTGVAPIPSAVPPIANYLDGGPGNDVLVATIAPGTPGASFLDGGAGNDRLTVFSGQGNILNGGPGKDTLVSGVGDETMNGGPGADVLVFAPGNGHDTATFQQGQDLINLTAFAASDIHSIGELNIQVADNNSIVSFDANDNITILDTPHLIGSDFLFA